MSFLVILQARSQRGYQCSYLSALAAQYRPRRKSQSRPLQDPPQQVVAALYHHDKWMQAFAIPDACQVYRIATRERLQLPVFSLYQRQSAPLSVTHVPTGFASAIYWDDTL